MPFIETLLTSIYLTVNAIFTYILGSNLQHDNNIDNKFEEKTKKKIE